MKDVMEMRLHVSNLDSGSSDKDLKHLFLPYGPVIGAKVMSHLRSPDGALSGLVEMESFDDAHAAATALNGSELGGRRVVVAWATPRQESCSDQQPMFESMNVTDPAERRQQQQQQQQQANDPEPRQDGSDVADDDGMPPISYVPVHSSRTFAPPYVRL
jgi:RNA recognition motif-containing protein